MIKAAVLYESNKRMPIVGIEQEAPGKGEVRIRIKAAGVCASDHHVMRGRTNFPLPMVLGHEGAGIVEEVGNEVPNIKLGSRCVLSFVPSCGYCVPCREGKGQTCATHRATGATMFDGTTRLTDSKGKSIYQFGKLGVFAESAIVPWQACHPIPDDLPMGVAALIGCAVTTGVGSVLNAPNMQSGKSVVVFGVGGVGINTVQGAVLAGATAIIAVDISDSKLEFAKQFGSTHTVNASQNDPVSAVMDITNIGADYGFETFGSATTLEQMMASLKTGGTGIMAGLTPMGSYAKLNMVDLVRNEKTLKGSYYGSSPPHVMFDTIIKLWSRGNLSIEKMIQRRYTLDQINEAYDDLHAGANGRGIIVF